MGFVMRLNSRDLVNDPKNGAEVYPITATNAVYRAGTDKNLEQILSELSNSADRKVIQDISYESTGNKLHKEFTDNTTEDITLPNWIKTIQCASGSDINTVGTPSVTASTNNSNTTLTFHQLKGAKGDKGDKGDTGDTGPQGPAGQNGTNGTNGSTPTVTADATVDSNTGTPSVTVTNTGTTLAPNFKFEFHNLKGTNGAPGKDGSTDVYDCNVSSENEFKSAVATSWIGRYTSNVSSIQSSWLYSKPSYDITVDGETITPKKVKVRIHFVQNFSMTGGVQYGLENCEIYGDHHTITISDDFILSGYGCSIRNVKFILHNSTLTNNNHWGIKIIPESGQHSYFIFDDCQFNNSINTSSTNTTKRLFVYLDSSNENSTIDIKIRDCNFNSNGDILVSTNNPKIILDFNNTQSPVLLSIFHTISMHDDEGNKSETNKFALQNYTGTSSNGKMRIYYDKLSDVDGVSTYSTSGNKTYHPNY